MLEALKRIMTPERRSSDALVLLAQRAMKHPGRVTLGEVRKLAASVISQANTEAGK